jgi:hypothetical protein
MNDGAKSNAHAALRSRNNSLERAVIDASCGGHQRQFRRSFGRG